MKSIISTSVRSTRAFPTSPVWKGLLRRGISTQELDATKGGEFIIFSYLAFILMFFRSRACCYSRLGVSFFHSLFNSSDKFRWAGFVLSRQLDKKKFQPVVVSPRTYFVFTPLLASTAVGTLEFRTTLESVRARSAGVEFFQGWADDVNFNEKKVVIEDATVRRPLQLSGKAFYAASLAEADQSQRSKKKGQVFDLTYDKLVIAVGCYSQTFGTPGVKENAFFLKDVVDARKLRRRILECEFRSKA
jgi:NADH dehydrogenase